MKTITILKDGHIHDGRELKTGETHTLDAHLADFLIERGTAKAEVRSQKSQVRIETPASPLTTDH